MRRILLICMAVTVLAGSGYALAAALKVYNLNPGNCRTFTKINTKVCAKPVTSKTSTVTSTVTTTVVGTTTVTTTIPTTTTAPTTTTVPTTTTNPNPPPSGTANLFLSPSGNDSCTRSGTAVAFGSAAGHICKTPAVACSLAQSGDTVIMEDGTYPSHMDGCAEGHQNYAQNVVFEPEPGHFCPMTYPAVPAAGSDTSCPVNLSGNSGDGQLGLSLGGNDDRACGVSGNPLPSTLAASAMSTWDTHLTFKGIYIGEMTAICAAHVTLDGVAGKDFFLREGIYDWTITNSDFGNENLADVPTIGDSLSTTSFPPLQDVTIENSLVHDFTSTNGEHGDGLFIQPSYNVTVAKDVFARDDCIPLYVNYAQNAGIGVHNLLVVGNVIHRSTQNNSGFGDCGQSLSLGDNDQFGTLAAFNSVSTASIGIRRSNSGTEKNTGIRIVGNVTSGIAAENSGNTFGCGPGTTADYNVLTEQAEDGCGTDNILGVSLPFTSEDTTSTAGGLILTPTLGNYQLVSGSPAIAEVPASWCLTDAQTQQACLIESTDINGNTRPAASHPGFYDAGAYEYSPPAGNVYLSAKGNDATCVRGDASHPCATPAKAWSIAQAGDTINVADGNYTSGCTLSGDKSSTVTFLGSANAKFACLMTFPSGTANAVVNGIDLYQVQGASANVTLENGALTCTDSSPYTLYLPDNFCSAYIGLSGGASNWLIQNESIGPSYDSEAPCGYPSQPNISRLADVSNITFKNVLIHDDRYGCSSQHTENIRIDVTGTDTSNITFDGVTFYNGPNSGLHGQGGGPNSADFFMGGPGTLSGLTIQNSVVWGSGTALDGADDLQIQNSVIRNNSFTSSMYFEYPTAPYPSSFKITNNIAPDQGCAIGGSHGSSGGYFSHNLWYYNSTGGSADKCASSDLSVNGAGVVNTIFNGYASGDFTLASGSPAIDAGSAVSGEYTPTDKNGLPRSCGSAPDIGAYERCPVTQSELTIASWFAIIY